MTVTTDTPGFTAEISAGDSPQGPWEPVSQSRTIQNRHRYTLENAEARYFLVWITELDSGSKHVNEVTARRPGARACRAVLGRARRAVEGWGAIPTSRRASQRSSP
jgi:CRISPR/Cas system endoribonuclease Cas6 (RAMP superfamily)